MRRGPALGYRGSGPPLGVAEKVAAAEDLGADSVGGRANGSDVFTPLS